MLPIDKKYIAEDVDNRDIDDPKLISIVIVMFRPNKESLHCLRKTLLQVTDEVDVIVINNGDNVTFKREIASLPIRYLKVNGHSGVCFSRNIGTAISNAEWILYLDDDGIPHPQLVQRSLNIITDKSFYAARGRVLPKTKDVYNAFQNHYDLGETRMPFLLNLEGITLIRKSHLEAIGGWNNKMLDGHEGEDLSFRLCKKFGKDGCLYLPEMILYHDFSDCLLKLLTKFRKYAKKKGGGATRTQEMKDYFSDYHRFMPPDKTADIVNTAYLRIKFRIVKKIVFDLRKFRPYVDRLIFVLRLLDKVGIKV